MDRHKIEDRKWSKIFKKLMGKSVTVFIEHCAVPTATLDTPSYNWHPFTRACIYGDISLRNIYLDVGINYFSASAGGIQNFPFLCCLHFYYFFVSHKKH
jgi:hypothetical protein